MVQFQFQFGDRRGGGRGVRSVPTYALTDWRAASGDDGTLTFRPSWRTVWRRSGITLVAAVFLGLQYWSLGWPWQLPQPLAPAPQEQARINEAARELQAQFEQNMTLDQRRQFAERVERARRDHDRRLAADRVEIGRRRRISRAFHWFFFEGLIALGVLPLLLAAWERVDLRNGPDDELIVRRRRFLTREHSWPQGTFGGVLCSVVERVHRSRRGWPQHLGWFWQIRLLPRHEQGGTAAPRFVDDPIVEFHVARQPDPPHDAKSPPKRVRAFLKYICRLAEIEPRAVQFGIVPDPGHSPRGFWERWRPRFRTQTVTYESEPHVESTTYDSRDDMPPEIQKRVDQLIQQGIPPEGITLESTRITIRDADGNERIYSSLDDLPPEARAMYDAARRKRRRR
jgi:hypothetical protein